MQVKFHLLCLLQFLSDLKSTISSYLGDNDCIFLKKDIKRHLISEKIFTIFLQYIKHLRSTFINEYELYLFRILMNYCPIEVIYYSIADDEQRQDFIKFFAVKV